MDYKKTFYKFSAVFTHTADEAGIPQSERFNDLYDKLPSRLREGIRPVRYLLAGDFQKLCAQIADIDMDIRREYELKQTGMHRATPAVASATSTTTTSTRAPMPFAATVPAKPQFPTAFVRQQTPATRQSTPVDEKITCYNCSEKGHYASGCDKPRRTDVKALEDEDLVDGQEKLGGEQGNDCA